MPPPFYIPFQSRAHLKLHAEHFFMHAESAASSYNRGASETSYLGGHFQPIGYRGILSRSLGLPPVNMLVLWNCASFAKSCISYRH